MKKWMIWAGAGVIGVILAFLLIPWGSLTIDSTDPMPTVTTPRDRTTVTAVDQPADEPDDPARVDEGVAGGGTAPDIGMPTEGAGAGAGSGDDLDMDEPINPAREARNERLKQPDMVLIRKAESRWKSLVRTIGSLPHDGAADHTMNRIDELRKDITAYRRTPDEYDINEMIERQKSIMGELKQTSYWTPEVQEAEAQLSQVMETYAAEMTGPQ